MVIIAELAIIVVIMELDHFILNITYQFYP